jgi:hypothetical protein
VTVHAVKELDESLFDAYTERKSDPIVGSLEPGIYAGHFDWRDCGIPTGIHTHTGLCCLLQLEGLHTLIAGHYALWPGFKQTQINDLCTVDGLLKFRDCLRNVEFLSQATGVTERGGFTHNNP